jgi:putative FmdB family regulatory protein
VPIYAYKCAACGHEKDVLQKISDAPLTVCPSCSAEAFFKQVTAAGFQLKGSGWYATDFRDSGKKKDGAAKDKPADATAATGTQTKADTKSDTAPASDSKKESTSSAKADSAASATAASKAPPPPSAA